MGHSKLLLKNKHCYIEIQYNLITSNNIINIFPEA